MTAMRLCLWKWLLLLAIVLQLCHHSLGELRLPLQRRYLARSTTALTTASSWLSLGRASRTSAPNHKGNRARTPLLNFRNIVYTGTLMIGSPPEPFTVVYDTGSADLWVFSALTSLDRGKNNHYYDQRRSTSHRSNGTSWSIEYGEGRASGHLSVDTVRIAEHTAVNQTFGEATEYTENFRSANDPTDGILGLSFAAISESHTPTVIDNLFNQGVIEKRMFSFYLTPGAESEGSEFILGEPLPHYAPLGLSWNPIVSQNARVEQWVIAIDSFDVDGRALGLCQSRACVALLDTGTSFIGVPTLTFLALKDRILSLRADCRYDANHLEIECSTATLAGLPSITITIDRIPYVLTPADYMVEGVVGVMQIVPNAGDADFVILGDTFLKTFYTVFDMDNQRVGIAVPPFTESMFNFHLALVLLACTAAIVTLLWVLKQQRTRVRKLMTLRMRRVTQSRSTESLSSSFTALAPSVSVHTEQTALCQSDSLAIDLAFLTPPSKVSWQPMLTSPVHFMLNESAQPSRSSSRSSPSQARANHSQTFTFNVQPHRPHQ